MGVDISRAFKAPFEDQDWVKKTLLGWLWFASRSSRIPAVYGALHRVHPASLAGDERLPEWDDFGASG